jgi:hypothetical protein
MNRKLYEGKQMNTPYAETIESIALYNFIAENSQLVCVVLFN